MANLSQIKRQRMIDFLETLKKEHTDDESIRAFTEIENQLREKKYGLVWEQHEEAVDVMMHDNIPVFTEVQEREITAADGYAYNFILEGDNLQSLYLLEKTHKGAIDVIYIDPPYNTGNKDFMYDDTYVDSEDGFRHSKWISFMNARLSLAKRLLKESGIIFISIGDYELSDLKLLCDEIFDENNCLGIVPRLMKTGGNKGRFFSPNIDYILVYAKDYLLTKDFKGELDENLVKKLYNKVETEGTKKGERYRPFGLYQSSLDARPNQRYYIECPDGTFVIPPGTTMPPIIADGEKVLPNPGDGCWRWSQDRYKEEMANGNILFTKSKNGVLIQPDGSKSIWNVYTKIWLSSREEEGQTPTNFISKYENRHSAKELKDLGINFDFAKPTELIKYLFSLTGVPKNATFLDFFAGSGSTGHAVMKMNAEDGGNRRFILCTNNEISEKKQISYFVDKGFISPIPRKGTKTETEWKTQWTEFKKTQKYADEIASDEYQALGICHSVTYPRIRTVITGKRPDGTKYSDGYPANLKYFKCGWTPRKPEDYLLSNALCLHIKEMIELQNGIEVDNTRNVLILNKADFRKYVMDDTIYGQIENVWVNQNIIFNSEEMERLNALGFKYIPREFFGQELKEAAE